MKYITRLTNLTNSRVWLTQDGRWTLDNGQAYAFDDDEAARRLKRLPKASAFDNNNLDEEKKDV